MCVIYVLDSIFATIIVSIARQILPCKICIQSKPPKVVQKVHKKSINIQDLKSIVCTNETEPHKVKKTIGESPVIAENEFIP